MKVGLIGAGNMARAMARGWGDPVLCSDAGSGRAVALAAELGGEATTNVEVARQADLVVLCHKPYHLRAVAKEIAPHVTAVVSVLGGTQHGELHDAYDGAAIFPMMPNTAVEVRRGITCYTPIPGVDSQLEQAVIALFERLGSVITVSREQMGVAAAVFSVGPAYQALLAEAQVDAAVRNGLSPALAGRLVTETMRGTAALLEHRAHDTLAVRREVTSPGGSTARGLEALERAGIRSAFQDAMNAVLWERPR